MYTENLFSEDESQDKDGLKKSIAAHSALNPEFREPMSPRARQVIDRLFSDEKGIRKPAREIARNIAAIRIRLSAIDGQLKINPLWQEILAIVEEKEANADGRPSGETVACSREAFDGSVRSEYKTHQECLTPAWLRLAVPRGYRNDGTRPLAVVNIDPDNINDTLLRNLGLPHLVPAKNTTWKQKLEAYAFAIPYVKQALARLEVVSLPDEASESRAEFSRMMRFKEGPQEGLLLGTQHYHTIKEKDKGYYLTDLHSHHRRNVSHIRYGYDTEVRKLKGEIENKVREIDRQIVEEWDDIKDSDAELKDVRTRLNKIVETLARVTNEHKVEIRNQVAPTISLKTQRRTRGGEVKMVMNPRAMRIKWHKSMDECWERINQIRRINGFIADDAHPLTVLIEDQHAPFGNLYARALEKRAGNKILDGDADENNRAQLCGKLRMRRADFAKNESGEGRIKYQPYLALANRITAHIDAVISHLMKDPMDKPAAAAEFVKMFNAARIERFYRDLQDFYGDNLAYDRPDKIPYFEMMAQALEDMKDRLNNVTVKPGKKVAGKRVRTEYADFFDSVNDDLLAPLIKKAWQGVKAMNPHKWQKAKTKTESDSIRRAAQKRALDLKREMQDLIRDFDLIKTLNGEADIPAAPSLEPRYPQKYPLTDPVKEPAAFDPQLRLPIERTLAAIGRLGELKPGGIYKLDTGETLRIHPSMPLHGEIYDAEPLEKDQEVSQSAKEAWGTAAQKPNKDPAPEA